MTEPSASFKNQDKLKAFQRQVAAPGQHVTTAKSSAATALEGR